MNKVLILFSGGIDSTATSLYYLQKGYKVQLITFDNGAEKGFDRSKHTSNLIKQKFRGKCSWKLLNSSSLFHEIAIKNLERDIKKYGNLVCCGCKIAMLAECIIYCKKNGIKIIADGFEKEQTYYPEQTPEYIKATDSFAKEYGISCEHPIYNMSSKEIKDVTINAGMREKPIQASCLFGLNRVKNKNIKKYVLDKLPTARQYIKKSFSK